MILFLKTFHFIKQIFFFIKDVCVGIQLDLEGLLSLKRNLLCQNCQKQPFTSVQEPFKWGQILQGTFS